MTPDAVAGTAAAASTADGATLLGVLPRLCDPATSTRRTAVARDRLVGHPATRALLDAGLRVLLEEVGDPHHPQHDAGDGRDSSADVPTRFFELLSASRVCAAASAVGPLRVTPSHLRDRWARHADYVEDLVAFALWRQRWARVLAGRLRALPVPAGEGDLPGVADAVAGAFVVADALPLTSRLELAASALAPVRPRLRAHRAEGFAQLDASWAGALGPLLAGVGRRPAAGCDVAEVAGAVGALVEGANLRLVALGESPQHREQSVRLLSAGLQGLWAGACEPAAQRRLDRFPWPQEPQGDVADVLTRLTHEVTGTRRTAQARRRLASDRITHQLLDGGLRVLAEELGVQGPGPARRVAPPGGTASRFFDVLSVSRVVSEARAQGGDGAEVTPAQLRDRWATQEHYVDDLVSYAVHQMQPVVAVLLRRARQEPSLDLPSALTDAAQELLRSVESSPQERLRLLLTALSRARPVVAARLVQLREEEERAVCAVLGRLIEGRRLRLRPGLELVDVCRAQVALGEGLVVRALTSGEDGTDDGGRSSLLLRATTLLFRGCVVPRHPGATTDRVTPWAG